VHSEAQWVKLDINRNITMITIPHPFFSLLQTKPYTNSIFYDYIVISTETVAETVCWQDIVCIQMSREASEQGQGVVGDPPSVRVLKWTERDSSSGFGGRLYSSLVIK